ncbi:MAG: glycosyltransferase family 9 protein, partial [Terriglobia bacterium]
MSERFLVVRLGSMGDIVHALPAVAALRRSFPQARIDWLVEVRWRALVELNPGVSRCLTIDTLAWRRQPWQHLGALGRALAALARADYDCAVDFQGLYKSAVLAWLADAPRRVGFHERALREPGSFLFYTERVLPPAGTHVVEMNLALVAHLGADIREPLAFDLPTTAEDEAYVENQLRRRGLEEFFILSPGGGWEGKCWPVARYAELHEALVQTYGWRGVVNVGPGEERLAAELIRLARAAEPAQVPLSPRQYIALARRARLVISGDSGPLHVAAALGTPAVGLYGPTDPVRNGPFGP